MKTADMQARFRLKCNNPSVILLIKVTNNYLKVNKY